MRSKSSSESPNSASTFSGGMPPPRSREARAAAISRASSPSENRISSSMGSVGETAGHRIGHHFEQMNDGGNLGGRQAARSDRGPAVSRSWNRVLPQKYLSQTGNVRCRKVDDGPAARPSKLTARSCYRGPALQLSWPQDRIEETASNCNRSSSSGPRVHPSRKAQQIVRTDAKGLRQSLDDIGEVEL